MSSIRRRLLLSLFVLWTTVWVAVALISMDRSGHEVGELMDAQLAQTAHFLSQIAATGHLPDTAGMPQALSPIGHPYESMISFQLWRKDLLISSFGAAPQEPLARCLGFSDQTIGQTRWRVFGLPTEQADELIYVAQSYSIREELIEYLTLQAMRPILWSLPVSALLIWLAVTDGLRPLNRLARDIRYRSAEQLSPIDARRVPTEIRPLTDALNGLMARLARALEAERHFVADASHELRTPFAIIRTHAQIAQRSRDPTERGEALRSLVRGLDRAIHLVSQLLVLSRVQQPTSDDEPHTCSLVEALSNAIEDAQDAVRAKDVDLVVRVPDGKACMVRLPPSALSILIGNLLDNAIKYGPRGGRIGVAVDARGEWVVLRVEDAGPGIPEADRSRVFDRFYRPAGQEASGAGLGLAIVRRICELHGAEVALLDCVQGPGLLVEVSLPRALG